MIEAPTTQERYTRAVQSSSLRVEADVRGDVDILIAAGWCKSRFGAALMRLQAEWDGAERWGIRVPAKPTKRAIVAEAQVEMVKGVRKITTASMEAARARLEKRYEQEMGRVMRALKTLPEVARMLQIKLLLDGQGAELAAPLLLYWLDPVCKVCHGRKFQLIRGTASLSERACGCCEGKGVVKAPGGEVGAEAIDLINSCVLRAGGEVRGACRY